MFRRFACPLLLAFLVGGVAQADYPLIRRLSSEDVLFQQLQADLSAYFRAVNRGSPALPGYRAPPAGWTPGSGDIPPLRLFLLRRPADMDLFSLAARLNLPYDTLATLNGLAGPAALAGREELLACNLPGLFVPERPGSSFEEILVSVSANSRPEGVPVAVTLPKGVQRFRFHLGQSFLSVERAFFLNILFRFPLPFRTLTSYYGARTNPFTGSSEFHHGVDLAAPEGMEVYAARDGRVERVEEEDPLLGKVVVLAHEGGYQTVYGHLSLILVSLQQPVRSGMIIGRVGSTGHATGPHLHFEVRRQGSSRDPLPLLPRLNGAER
jgi:murein DD-endopeptidase MepM/ murein hydrolase activator NlpD